MNISVALGERTTLGSLQLVGDGDFEPAVLDQYRAGSKFGQNAFLGQLVHVLFTTNSHSNTTPEPGQLAYANQTIEAYLTEDGQLAHSGGQFEQLVATLAGPMG